MWLKAKNRHNSRGGLDISGYEKQKLENLKPSSTKSRSKRSWFIQHIRWKQLIILWVISLIIVNYFERVKPYYTLKKCMWKKWEDWPSESDPHHTVIIGDPQIVDEYSYPSRGWIGMKITQFFSDNYLHRNHNLINRVLKPDSIIFSGDLFDGGREWNDTRWIKEYKRFNNVFNPLEGVRQFRQIPGNHDVGFGNGVDFAKYARFKAYFGDADEVVTLGNHSIVLIDTVSLSCSEDENVSKRSREFLDSFKESSPYKQHPRIVFSHVPLYRFNEFQKCGSLRESKSKFPVVRGKQYQTVLEYQLSTEILNNIEPIMLFSGDDHDYCHVRHPISSNAEHTQDKFTFTENDHPGVEYADEVTLKVSSMTGGIKRPGIQLLSMWNPGGEENLTWKSTHSGLKTVDSKTAKTHLCYLPSGLQPLIHYATFVALGIFWIYVCSFNVNLGRRLHSSFKKGLQRFVGILGKIYRGGSQSVELPHLKGKKPPSLLKRYVDSIIIEWDIERENDFTTFLANSFIFVATLFFTLLWYFNSI